MPGRRRRTALITLRPIIANASHANPCANGMKSGGSSTILPGSPKAIQPGTSLYQDPKLTSQLL